jgi:hypothetical protein
MASDDGSEGDASGDTREQGIEFGQLKEKLASHDYPATGDELLEAYGDFELELPGGSATLREILGKRQSEEEGDDDDVEYESADDVRQSIHNMVGSDAIGRENYSDRGGSLPNEYRDEEDEDRETL